MAAGVGWCTTGGQTSSLQGDGSSPSWRLRCRRCPRAGPQSRPAGSARRAPPGSASAARPPCCLAAPSGHPVAHRADSSAGCVEMAQCVNCMLTCCAWCDAVLPITPAVPRLSDVQNHCVASPGPVAGQDSQVAHLPGTRVLGIRITPAVGHHLDGRQQRMNATRHHRLGCAPPPHDRHPAQLVVHLCTSTRFVAMRRS